MKNLYRGVGAAFALLLCMGNALAAGTPPVQSTPDPNQILLPDLNGLRFVSTPAAIDKNGYTRHGVAVDGPYLLYRPGIYQQLVSFLGKPLRAGDLSRISAV